MRLTNKIALVTGASSGLGAAICQIFAAEGAQVMGLGRDQARLAAVQQQVKEAGGNIQVWPCDLADASACSTAVQHCIKQFGGLDILVNNAGSHILRHSTDVKPDEWQQDLAVNLSGPFFLSQAAIPELIQRQGNIVNVSSIAGQQGQAYSAGYCAAKHGLIGLTRALAIEYTHQPIRINAVCPGGMATPQVENFSAPDDVDFNLVMRAAGLRGMMQTEEVAKLILFLASDEASAMHGAIINADQGKTVG